MFNAVTPMDPSPVMSSRVPDGRSPMQFPVYPWYAYFLIGLAFLLLLLAASYVMSRYYATIEVRYFGESSLVGTPMEGAALETATLEGTPLVAPAFVRRRRAMWSRLATNIYVAIAVYSGLIGLASNFLPSPLWLAGLLAGCTFGAAYLAYKTWPPPE